MERLGLSGRSGSDRVRRVARTDFGETLQMALLHAYDAGIDIANNSFNPGLVNGTIEVVNGVGMNLVAAAGNEQPTGNTTTCTLNWPALRPSVISVGGLNTEISGSIPPTYEAAGRETFLSVGGVPMIVDGVGRIDVGLDLMAPSRRTFMYGPSNTYVGAGTSGTSIASPMVAGLAALWIDHAVTVGLTTPHSVGWIKTALFLGAEKLGTSTFATTTALNKAEGFGRSKIYRIDGDIGTNNFVIRNVSVTPSAPIQYHVVSATPLPASTTQLDVVMHWTEAGDLTNAADVILTVESTCGGFTAVKDDSSLRRSA